MERWCAFQLSTGNEETRAKSVGLLMPIYTESMEIAQTCEGKQWRVVEEKANEFRDQIGISYWKPGNTWVCEHMLEMD